MGESTEIRAGVVYVHAEDLQEMIEYGVGDLYTDRYKRDWRVMVTDKLYDTTRWGTLYQYVFQDRSSGKFYQFIYEIAAGDSNVDFWGEFGEMGTLREVFEKRETVISYG